MGTTWPKGPGFVGLVGAKGNWMLMPDLDDDHGLPLVERGE